MMTRPIMQTVRARMHGAWLPRTPQRGAVGGTLPMCLLRRACIGGALATLLVPRGVRAAQAAAPAYEVRPWPAGKPLPPLDLTDLEGRRWTLGDLQGRATLLNFWASWCEPCADEMPSLQRLAAERGSALRVLGVNYQERADEVRRFAARMRLSFPLLLDAKGEAARAWTPRVFPSSVVLDRRARPLFTVVGQFDWAGPAAQRLLEPLARGREGAGIGTIGSMDAKESSR